MALLTALVWLAMLMVHGRNMPLHGIVPNDMPTRVRAGAKLGAAQGLNNNLMSLFELPDRRGPPHCGGPLLVAAT
jgi:hypothetical protein